MKKNELLREIVDKAENEYTQAEVNEILTTFAKVIVNRLRYLDEKIPFSDLGNFTVKHVPEKNGIMATTGKAWTKPAHKDIVFKTSVKYKDV